MSRVVKKKPHKGSKKPPYGSKKPQLGSKMPSKHFVEFKVPGPKGDV